MTVLATCATFYGITGSFSSFPAALVLAGSAREIDPVHRDLTRGHAIWLAYGIGIANYRSSRPGRPLFVWFRDVAHRSPPQPAAPSA